MPTNTTGIATEFIQFSRTSNATLTDSDGKIKWAPANLLLNSESFDTSSWTKTTATINANAIASPNGTFTADKFASTNTNTGDMYQNVSKDASAIPYTVGVFAKTGGFNWLQIAMYDGASTGSRFWFNLSTGAKGSTAAIGAGFTDTDYNISSVGGGWYYCWAKATTNTGTTNRILLYPTNADSTFTPGNGTDGVHLWGAHAYRSDLGGMQPNTSAYTMYNPTTPKNLLGYTESLTTGWTNSNTTDAIVSEINPVGLTGAVDVAATAGNGTLLSSLSLLASPYTFSIWLKRKTGSGTVEITVDGTTYVAAAVTATWTRFSTTLTPSAGTKTPGIRLVTSGDAVYAWGAQLSDSASLDTYAPVYGAAVTSAAYYGPRRDFNGSTLACNGLLVEEQRVNSLLYSSTFSDAYWTKQTVTLGTPGVAPDGTTTAALLIPSNTPDVQQLYRLSVVSSSTCASSIYAKANGINTFEILDGASGSNGGVFNLSTGVATNKGTGVASMVPVGNGWYRCVSVATTTGFRLYCPNSSGTASGDGTSGIYIWGAQLEAGAFATSYIPTTGAATVTRNADVASVSTQAFPYSQGVGSLVVNWKVGQTTNPADRLIWLDDTDAGIYDNYISLRQGGASPTAGAQGTVDTSASAAASVVVNTPSLSVGSDYKAAFAFAANDLAFCLNGGTVVTNASATVPSGIDLMRIGGHRDSTYINGHIRQITYLPRRISNSELVTRTS